MVAWHSGRPLEITLMMKRYTNRHSLFYFPHNSHHMSAWEIFSVQPSPPSVKAGSLPLQKTQAWPVPSSAYFKYHITSVGFISVLIQLSVHNNI